MLPFMRSILMLIALCAAAHAVEYKGKWASGHSGDNGEIRVKLETDGEATFTHEGREIKAKLVKSTSEGDSMELEFHFTLDGTNLTSVWKATRSDGKLTAKYVTSVRGEASPVDGGTIEMIESK